MSFEQQLANARKEGKEIGKRAKAQDHPAAKFPGSESLAQEQEINDYDITAQQLDDILKQPITLTDKEGNVTETCDHIEDVLETKEGEKICEMFAKFMTSNAQDGRKGLNARTFIAAYSALTQLPQEHQDKIEAVFAQVYGSDLSTAITNVREVFVKEMTSDAQNGRDSRFRARLFIVSYSALTSLPQEYQDKIEAVFAREYAADLSTAITNVREMFVKDMAREAQKSSDGGVGTWSFITAYSALIQLSQEDQDKIEAVFAREYGSDLSTAITNVRETFAKEMATNARNGRDSGAHAWIFIRSLTATQTLRDHYQKLSTEQNAQIELSDTTDTQEPLIPQKNF